MPVKIRLARRGRKKRAIYDVVVADVRAPRDGKFIEKLGSFNPNHHPAIINIDVDSAFKWVMNGAQPTDTAKKLLSTKGVLLKKHLQVGVNKGAITQEEADKKFGTWMAEKETAAQKAVDSMVKVVDKEKKERLEAESKVNLARVEYLAKKQNELIAAEEAAKAESAEKEGTKPEKEEEKSEETSANEETPAKEKTVE